MATAADRILEVLGAFRRNQPQNLNGKELGVCAVNVLPLLLARGSGLLSLLQPAMMENWLWVCLRLRPQARLLRHLQLPRLASLERLKSSDQLAQLTRLGACWRVEFGEGC